MAKQKFKMIPFYLSDAQAEIIGQKLAADLGLEYAKNSTLTTEIYLMPAGSFTNKGIARRVHRFIQENL